MPSVWCLCQVLLVSSRSHPDRWIVPGGGMEPEEEPSAAAVREVCEEVIVNPRKNFIFIIFFFLNVCTFITLYFVLYHLCIN
uniref:Nudix hydrolase domain-containing protein n=1 Tax=Sinocyclocheilus grahami TaxID=75366 RepID=A0A672K4C2_SINGR